MKVTFVRNHGGGEVWKFGRREHLLRLEEDTVFATHPHNAAFLVSTFSAWGARNIKDALLNQGYEVEYPEDYEG